MYRFAVDVSATAAKLAYDKIDRRDVTYYIINILHVE
jgi:hypothetical protein